ncbi:hypothetical protein B0E54_01935 [Micromonospora sp. MH99]|nr:hypothetical protein [Micromonospora sp. MH99]
MTAAMRDIAAALDQSAHDAHLLRFTNNAVFALPTAGIVIRIARTHQLRDRATKVIRLARWFADIDAPTIRLAHVEQPIDVGDLVASVWQYIAPRTPAATVEDLGTVLRDFHALGVPPFPVPKWNPIGDARQRLSDAEGLSEPDRDFLATWCDLLEPRAAVLNEGGPQALVHGDAHVGNLLREPSGRVVMCDFDSTSVGPWQIDLAAVAVAELRFGTNGRHLSMATAYGFDVTRDPLWEILREVRELKMIAAVMPYLATSPQVAAEFTNRLNSISHGDSTARWIPFADLSRPKPIR